MPKTISRNKAQANNERRKQQEVDRALATMGAYEVRRGRGKDHRVGVFLRDYNVRVATFMDGASGFMRSMRIVCDVQNETRRKGGNSASRDAVVASDIPPGAT